MEIAKCVCVRNNKSQNKLFLFFGKRWNTTHNKCNEKERQKNNQKNNGPTDGEEKE